MDSATGHLGRSSVQQTVKWITETVVQRYTVNGQLMDSATGHLGGSSVQQTVQWIT